MLFHYSRSFKKKRLLSYLEPVKEMLNKTWNLTGHFSVPSGIEGQKVIELFNLYFKKLNSIITNILKNIIALSSLAPFLQSFSIDFKNKFDTQHKRINEISDSCQNMKQMTDEISQSTKNLNNESSKIVNEIKEAIDLGEKSMEQIFEIGRFADKLVGTITILEENSKSIESITDTINSIADETNMLSLNARIEAARAGEAGKGFAVIAQEVAGLSKQSGDAATRIRDQLLFLKDKINETVSSVKEVRQNLSSGEDMISKSNNCLYGVEKSFGLFSTNLADINDAVCSQNDNVGGITRDVEEMETVVEYQKKGVESLLDTANSINKTCDEMVLSAGVFHLSNHDKAVEIVNNILKSFDMKSFNKSKMEGFMKKSTLSHEFIELMYVTDLNGVQVTENIYSSSVDKEKRKAGLSANWSSKEWFTRALKNEKPFVSNVYRSSATDSFCFTISGIILNEKDEKTGVLGIDINFGDILSI